MAYSAGHHAQAGLLIQMHFADAPIEAGPPHERVTVVSKAGQGWTPQQPAL